jgi:cytochrome P450
MVQANLLAWCMYFLGQNPTVQKKLQEEVDTVLGDRNLTLEDIRHLKYCKQTLEETLRLRPPVTSLIRSPSKDSKFRIVLLLI